MSPVPVSTCLILKLPKTEAGHQQHSVPPDSCACFQTSYLACMNTFLASSAPLSLWKDKGKHSRTIKLPHTLEAAASSCTKGISCDWSCPRAGSLQPAFISTTRINAAHKDACVINASRFLLSHHVLQQLVNTKRCEQKL